MNKESMVERCLRQNVDTVEQQSARIAELEDQLAAARAELTRLWLIAYSGEYTKARNWGADHQQADTYARRAAGDVRVAGEKI